jgi:hypothetical protein
LPPLQLKLIDGLKTAVPPGQSLFAADGFSITGGYNSDAQEVRYLFAGPAWEGSSIG